MTVEIHGIYIVTCTYNSLMKIIHVSSMFHESVYK